MMNKKIVKSLVLGSLAACISHGALAQDFTGKWVFSSANAVFTQVKGDIVQHNEGGLRSVCSISQSASNTLITDCFNGAQLSASGNTLTSADGSWQLTANAEGGLTGAILVNQTAPEGNIQVSMDITMKRMTTANNALGTLSLTKNGVTQTTAVLGYSESAMTTTTTMNGKQTQNAVVRVNVTTESGSFSLLDKAVGNDMLSANVGDITVSDESGVESTLNSTDSSISLQFNGQNAGDGQLYTGAVSITL